MSAVWPLELFEQLPSTNSEVKRQIATGRAQEGPFGVLALSQSAGYGRQGRIWESPLGGLYLSVGYPTAVELKRRPSVSLVVALAVRRALLSIANVAANELLVKWPNDLVVARRDGSLAKLCGISVEAIGDNLCIGIGVNVFKADDHRPDHVLTDAGYPIAYLDDFTLLDSEHPSKRSWLVAVAKDVIESLTSALGRWTQQGFEAFVDEFNECSALRVRRITATDIEEKHRISGVAGEVRADGCLQLIDESGCEHWLHSGETHLLATERTRGHRSGGS